MKLFGSLFKDSINCPVFFWLEGIDFIFTVNDEFKGNGLNATC
ncbi:Uncharacterised protein [Mycobacterium tuberculosis]|nr:Uncharacterised protein [Streptococcus pneumoniae]CKU87233.1 Uncharacterised protein [Mycobacterium tuberculosis]CKU88760.1 Uncharacterised protein [Mycobacterium tuberculosis]CKX55340.1 Uncharacterised protein [Mycobacterium tuberculosis]